jgi:hypothetical protein
MGEFC